MRILVLAIVVVSSLKRTQLVGCPAGYGRNDFRVRLTVRITPRSQKSAGFPAVLHGAAIYATQRSLQPPDHRTYSAEVPTRTGAISCIIASARTEALSSLRRAPLHSNPHSRECQVFFRIFSKSFCSFLCFGPSRRSISSKDFHKENPRRKHPTGIGGIWYK